MSGRAELTQRLTLLEFIGCCFEKNELMDGGLSRYNVYETPLLAEQQVDALVKEAIALLGEPGDDTYLAGLRDCQWPTLRIMHRGLAVLVVVPVRVYWLWQDTAAWTRAGDDISALLAAAKVSP
jgi:hypothetical protein